MSFDGKSVILAPKQKIAEHILTSGLRLYGSDFRNKIDDCCSIEMYRKHFGKITTQPSAVFIDVASFAPGKAMDSIYNLCVSYVKNSDMFFIVLVE